MNYVTRIILVATMAGGILGSPMSTANEKVDIAEAITQEKNITNIYRAYFPNEDIARKAVISFSQNLYESHMEEGYLIMELTPEEQEKLRVFDFTFKPATEFINKRDARLDQIQRKMANPASRSDVEVSAIPGYPCYETVEETFAAAEDMVSTYSNLAEFIDIGDSWEKTQGLGGYDIKVLKLTNKSTGGNKPVLFINSAIHAREYTTAPLNLAFAKWLVEGYNNDADATWLLDHHEMHLLLQGNPDARKKAEAGLSWRKNANQNYCGATSNNRGVDLNRNFTERWNITNGNGSSGNQCNLTYRGPSPGSEPETQAMEEYVRSIFADRRGPSDNDAAPLDTSGIHIDIHSYSELVLWPWGDKNALAPNGIELQTLGRKFAFFNGYRPQQSIGLYPTDGTTDSVSYAELGVAAYTFELGTSFFQSCSAYNNTIEPDNLPALIYAAKVVRTPYVTPAGPDVLNLALGGGASTGGVEAGTSVSLSALASDTRYSTRGGNEPTQNIAAAEYYIDIPPWESGANPVALLASDGAFNEKSEDIAGSIDTSGLSVGSHIVYTRAQDANGVWGAISASFLVIVDDLPPPELAAEFSASCDELTCTFDASASTGDITSFSWSFGDGSSGSGESTSHTYSSSGTYNVTLTVASDTDSDSEQRSVIVTETPPSNIDISLSSRSFFFFSWVDIRWTGASSSQVDIYEGGNLLTTTTNDGRYRYFTDPGTYTFKVCEQGSTTACSPEETISF